MARFLVTNDDGYRALGLRLLADALRELGEVYVVAPDQERSATSHSLTLSRPLKVARLQDRVFAVDGTPTDCVMVAVHGLTRGMPDFVVAGVNHGPNLGDDVTYSGTVAAAFEGTLLGIPSLAISYASRDATYLPEWREALVGLLRQITGRPFPPDTLLNINLPPRPPAEARGVMVTTLGKRVYKDPVLRDSDPQGETFYWIGGQGPEWQGESSCDFRAIEEGYVSLTPLHLDLTNYAALQDVHRWEVSLPRGG